MDVTVSGILAILFVAACSSPGGADATVSPDAGPIEAGNTQAEKVDATEAEAGVADAAKVDAPDVPPVLSSRTLEALRTLSPNELPAAPPDVTNRYSDDPAAASLGQQLFFDPGFSGPLLDSDNNGDASSLGRVGESGKVACSGCHIAASGFLDTRSVRQTVSLAAGWGHRKTPTLLDIGQTKLIMWDGRHDALFNQPFGALENGVEMNSSRLYAAEQIYERYRAIYESVFGPIAVPLDDSLRFPQLDGSKTGCRKLSVTATGIFSGVDCHGVPGDGAEFDGMTPQDQDAVTRVWANAGKAIAAYERLLVCGSSRFDEWMHGKVDALTPAEQRGAALFVGEREDGTSMTGCNTCHSGPFLTDQTFHNVGVQPAGVGPAGTFVDVGDTGALGGLTAALTDPLSSRGKFSDRDDGRLPTTVPPTYNGAFRTPSLRCVALRPSMMHTGQIRTKSALADTVAFFSHGGGTSGYEGTSEIKPLDLTEQEQADLVAFLRSLTGRGPSAELLSAPALP